MAPFGVPFSFGRIDVWFGPCRSIAFGVAMPLLCRDSILAAQAGGMAGQAGIV